MIMIQRNIQLGFAALAIGGLFGACGGSDGEDDGGSTECLSAKCDTPGGPADKQCEARQAEVLNSSQRGFTPTDIRWACADVEGVNAVNRDDRGQEYCEYFALFQPPTLDGGDRPDAVDLGRTLGNGSTTEHGVCAEGESGDDCRVTLSEDQLFWLEDNPSEIVGACVFTTWHADVKDDICDGECTAEQQVYGFPFTAENFRMKVSFNSNRAAADLVQRCYDPSGNDKVPEDWANVDDPYTEPFFRGCMEVQDHFGTGWRRSDPSVCAVSNRLRECGCAAPGVTNGTELGDAVVPPQPRDGQSGEVTKRGFDIATWDNRDGLPPGCRYGNFGDGSKTLALCDLTAADVLASRSDPKEACRAAYGNNIVVHVPLPASAITCNPPEGPLGAGCGELPWNIGQEGESLPADGGADAGADTGAADTGAADTGAADTGAADTGAADTGGAADGGTASNCGEAHAEGGCTDACIQDCVCEQDSFCCDSEWDDVCVGEVTSFGCDDSCGAAGG
jgi:hypothetical protein